MKQKLFQKGFTLVEAMVAISILSLAVTAPLIIAQKSIGSAIYARDQVTAFYLAQEAIEYVRNVRDSNRLSKASWLDGLSECLQSASGGEKCTIDAHIPDFSHQDAITACSGGTCPVLKFDSSSGFYGYCPSGNCSTWTPTAFTRTVSVDDRGDANARKEASISVTVSWSTNLLFQRSFTVKEYIFNL